MSKFLSQHTLHTDFCIIGGGMAGICAALAAARNGLKVVLVQDRSVLGGNASSEIKMHIVGADCHGGRPGSRESGLIEELKLEDAFRNPHRSYSQWDHLLYEKVALESNITLLLDTDCYGCTLDEASGGIRSARALRNSTEDDFEIFAKFFADCSGDSRLAAEAGADFHVGREDREKYGESLAQPTPDRKTLGSSILLTARKYDTPQPYHAPSWTRKFTKEDLKHRPIWSYEYGYWWFEWGGHFDTIKDNEMIRHELLRITLGIWDYIKNSGNHPDAENWALDWVGAIPGKRESRRLLGPHILKQQDLQGGTIFPDAVAYGGWAMDLHPPEGVDVPEEKPFTPHGLAHLYTIPLRCLYSRNIPNLLFAGRNISASHVAFSSTRVMATCAINGQAIGTAAAVAAELGKTVDELTGKEEIRLLQQRLLKDDAFIPGYRNQDPADLARTAKITASSEAEGSPAANVVDGITRVLNAKMGEWADEETHNWASTEVPAWIELEFPAPVSVREIHLTWDSGFQRELILSPSDRATSKCVRGPQPETVKSYQILGDGQVLAEESANYHRKRVHKLETPVQLSRLRILARETWGIEAAHLFEVRVY